jgi:hypothetical protein
MFSRNRAPLPMFVYRRGPKPPRLTLAWFGGRFQSENQFQLKLLEWEMSSCRWITIWPKGPTLRRRAWGTRNNIRRRDVSRWYHAL